MPRSFVFLRVSSDFARALFHVVLQSVVFTGCSLPLTLLCSGCTSYTAEIVVAAVLVAHSRHLKNRGGNSGVESEVPAGNSIYLSTTRS